MIKKSFYFVISLFLFFLIIQIGINYLHKKHDFYYTINSNNNFLFKVNEIYKKDKEVDYYFFNLKYQKRNFNFDIDNIFNGQKNIIKDIEVVENENIICLVPIFIKKLDSPIIACNDGNRQVSFGSVKNKINIYHFKSFAQDKVAGLQNSDKQKTFENIPYYYRNFSAGEYVVLYKYKNIHIFNEKYNRNFAFSSKGRELYKNEYGIMHNEYYLIPKFDDYLLINGYYIINVLTGMQNFVAFDSSISKSSYIQGIVDDKLYIMDRGNANQFAIEIKSGKLEEISSDGFGSYFNGDSWEKKAINNFTDQVLTFNQKKFLGLENYQYQYAIQDKKAFYFYNKNKEFYKVYKNKLKEPIYLFTNPNALNLVASNGKVFYLVGNTIYKFDDYGEKPLIVDNEMVYNNTNIFSAYVHNR